MENIISVIIITYNQERTIGRAIESVMEQECRLPFEIVIGEDGSTDNTRQICEDYARRYPHIIRLMGKAPNKGVVDNYFDCLLECKGKYIADCAGDDFWVDPHKLEKEVTVLEAHPDVTLVHTGWMYYNEETKTTASPGINPFGAYISDGKKMLEAIITQTRRPVIHLCTAMYRAEVMLEAYKKDVKMFRNKDFGCEDMQICFIMAYMGKIAYLPDVTLHYGFGHDTVSSSTDDRKQFDFVKKVTNLSVYICDKYGIRTPAVDAYLKQRLFALMMHAFRSKSKILYNEAKECQARWGIGRPLKVTVAEAVMKHSVTWHAALYARKLFVRMKHCFNTAF